MHFSVGEESVMGVSTARKKLKGNDCVRSNMIRMLLAQLYFIE